MFDSDIGHVVPEVGASVARLATTLRPCLKRLEIEDRRGVFRYLSAGGMPFSAILLPMFTLKEERETFRLERVKKLTQRMEPGCVDCEHDQPRAPCSSTGTD